MLSLKGEGTLTVPVEGKRVRLILFTVACGMVVSDTLLDYSLKLLNGTAKTGARLATRNWNCLVIDNQSNVMSRLRTTVAVQSFQGNIGTHWSQFSSIPSVLVTRMGQSIKGKMVAGIENAEGSKERCDLFIVCKTDKYVFRLSVRSTVVMVRYSAVHRVL